MEGDTISNNTTCLSASFLKALSIISPERKWATGTVNWLICSMMCYRVREEDKTCDLRVERQCCTKTADLDLPSCNFISKLLEKQSLTIGQCTETCLQDCMRWQARSEGMSECDSHEHTHIHTGQLANKRSHSVLPYSHRLLMIWFLLLVWTGQGAGGEWLRPRFSSLSSTSVGLSRLDCGKAHGGYKEGAPGLNSHQADSRDYLWRCTPLHREINNKRHSKNSIA